MTSAAEDDLLLPNNSRDAWLELVVGVLTADQQVPCTGSDMWTSPLKDDRRMAANACASCPVLELCGRYADQSGESWFVYGGRDRRTARELSDRPPRRRNRPSRVSAA